MRLYTILLITLSCLPALGMEPTYDVTITTADKKQITIPRWQVRESNTLYTLFLEELQQSPDTLPVCITAPTLSRKELKLYSTALQQNDFDSYYKEHLTPEQQRMLIIAAGEHARNKKNELISKLHDVAMSTKLLCLHIDNEMLKDNIFPLLPSVRCVINHFKRDAIIENALQKNIHKQLKPIQIITVAPLEIMITVVIIFYLTYL